MNCKDCVYDTRDEVNIHGHCHPGQSLTLAQAIFGFSILDLNLVDISSLKVFQTHGSICFKVTHFNFREQNQFYSSNCHNLCLCIYIWRFKQFMIQPRLVWLTQLGITMQNEWSLVRFLVSTPAWVSSQVPVWECNKET